MEERARKFLNEEISTDEFLEYSLSASGSLTVTLTADERNDQEFLDAIRRIVETLRAWPEIEIEFEIAGTWDDETGNMIFLNGRRAEAEFISSGYKIIAAVDREKIEAIPVEDSRAIVTLAS